MPIKTIIGLHGYQYNKKEISRRDPGGLLKTGTFTNPYTEDDWQIIEGVGWSSLGAVKFYGSFASD